MQNYPTSKCSVSGTPEHTAWIDFARLVAMLLMLACHCCDPFNCTPVASDEYKFWGAVYGSFFRPCVPVFVMITGLLLLPVKEQMGGFYKKRIGRVLPAFLIWSAIFCLFPWAIGVLGYGADTVAVFFPYSTWGNVVPAQDLASSLKNVAQIPLNFSSFSVHMWYAYLLIGLYLFLPIFSAWFAQASENAKRVFLGIWGISLFVPYLREFVSANLFGTCAWNEFGLFYCFSGFAGYLLLGSLVGKMKEISWTKTLAFAVPAFAVGYWVSFRGFRTMYVDGATDAQIELFWTYCSPNVVLMTLALFLVCKKVKITSVPAKRLLLNFSMCSFGIYMSHYFFVGPAYLLAKSLPVWLIIPASSLVGFAGAWIFVALIRQILPKLGFRIFFG